MILRDGPEEELVLVHETAAFAVDHHPAPDEAYATGCHWPPATSFEIPREACQWGASGFYVLRGFAVGPEAAAGIETGAAVELY